ncbi:ATP-dependent RNA helicase DBP10-like [Zerene cesonia]|nr:ATP-dependent RNA helicase DBP10-like [Zerene cesonia]
MIRTESGGRVPASYRSGKYDEWRRRNHADADAPAQAKPPSEFRPRWMKHNERVSKKMQGANEMRDTQQIVKERLRKDKIKQRLKHKSKGKKRKR